MDPYVLFFVILGVICVIATIGHRVIAHYQQKPTANPTSQKAVETSSETATRVRDSLSDDERRNLARLVLAIANQGPYSYGTPPAVNTIRHTFPLIQAMQQAVANTSGRFFSSRRIINKPLDNTPPEAIVHPPTTDEYNEMIELLAKNLDFLAALANNSSTLRGMLNFLRTTDCNITRRIPDTQAVTMREVRILEAIRNDARRQPANTADATIGKDHS